MLSIPKKITLSFELFPPKVDKEASFWKVIDDISEFDPAFISVTCGAGGTATHKNQTADIVCQVQEKTSIQSAAHLTAIGKTREEIDALAHDYWQRGIRHIVALRGDTPSMNGVYQPTPNGYAYAADLVKGLKKVAPFEISVAGYPEKHPEARSLQSDIDNLKRKLDAGADRVLTQFFFDPHYFLHYRELAAAQGVDIPIIPGILPIVNFKRASDFAQKCETHIPQILADLFDKTNGNDEAAHMLGVYFAIKQCQLLHQEGVNQFHFFTLNTSKMLNIICFLLKNMHFKDFYYYISEMQKAS